MGLDLQHHYNIGLDRFRFGCFVNSLNLIGLFVGGGKDYLDSYRGGHDLQINWV